MAAAKDKTDQVSADEKTQKPNEVRFIEKLNEFVQKNRKNLLLTLAAIVVIFAGVIIGFTVQEKLQIKAFTTVDAFNERYQALREYIGSEEAEAVSKQADINALLDDLNGFSAKNSGYAAARAYSISADIYEAQKKWAESEKAWSAAAKAAGKSYFAPVSFYNAAVAAEEQENIEAAIDHYNRVIEFEKTSFLAARAQFAIGRLQESRSNKEAALEAYRNLLSKWPGDQLWANLAQSRIIVLSN